MKNKPNPHPPWFLASITSQGPKQEWNPVAVRTPQDSMVFYRRLASKRLSNKLHARRCEQVTVRTRKSELGVSGFLCRLSILCMGESDEGLSSLLRIATQSSPRHLSSVPIAFPRDSSPQDSTLQSASFHFRLRTRGVVMQWIAWMHSMDGCNGCGCFLSLIKTSSISPKLSNSLLNSSSVIPWGKLPTKIFRAMAQTRGPPPFVQGLNSCGRMRHPTCGGHPWRFATVDWTSTRESISFCGYHVWIKVSMLSMSTYQDLGHLGRTNSKGIPSQGPGTVAAWRPWGASWVSQAHWKFLHFATAVSHGVNKTFLEPHQAMHLLWRASAS